MAKLTKDELVFINRRLAPFSTPYAQILSRDGTRLRLVPPHWRGVPMHACRLETIRANLFRGRG